MMWLGSLPVRSHDSLATTARIWVEVDSGPFIRKPALPVLIC